MAQLTAEQIDRTIESCRTHLAETGETFRANLDCAVRLTAADATAFAAEALAPFEGPGLAVSFKLGEQGLILLVPESISLPDWYREPGLSENNRLQTFAHELSLQLLPADLQADRYSASFAPSLKEFADQTSVNPSAKSFEVTAFASDAGETDAPLAKLLLIVPVDALPQPEPAADAEADANIGAFPDDDVLDAALSGTKEAEANTPRAMRRMLPAFRCWASMLLTTLSLGSRPIARA